MTRAKRIHNKLNDDYAGIFDAAFKEAFGFEVETKFCLGEMSLVSTPVNDEVLTEEHKTWFKAFEDGYSKAMAIVGDFQ